MKGTVRVRCWSSPVDQCVRLLAGEVSCILIPAVGSLGGVRCRGAALVRCAPVFQLWLAGALAWCARVWRARCRWRAHMPTFVAVHGLLHACIQAPS